MEKVTLSAIKINGLKIHANMTEEMNGNGKIGAAWEEFYGKFPGEMENVSYGVYTNYSSEDCHTADFDLYIGTEEVQSDTAVTIPAGSYLKYSVKGEMPQAVIDAWPKIEEYLNSDGAEKANHQCDFEKYISMEEAEIYISIEA